MTVNFLADRTFNALCKNRSVELRADSKEDENLIHKNLRLLTSPGKYLFFRDGKYRYGPYRYFERQELRNDTTVWGSGIELSVQEVINGDFKTNLGGNFSWNQR